MNRCIFCPGPANSREHGWAEWALKRAKPSAGGIVGQIAGDQVRSDPLQKAIRIKCVCVDCNEGWMSRLEQAVIPTVGCMMTDLAVSLDPDQQRSIAAWAVKTAMVWEFTGSATRRIYYSDDERQRLGRDGIIPPSIGIWLARYGGDKDMMFTQGTDVRMVPGDDGSQIHGYVTTTILQRFVLQLLSVRTPGIAAQRIIVHAKPGPWDRACVQVWPTVRDRQAWPPPASLDGGIVSFHDFLSRWSFGPAVEDDAWF